MTGKYWQAEHLGYSDQITARASFQSFNCRTISADGGREEVLINFFLLSSSMKDDSSRDKDYLVSSSVRSAITIIRPLSDGEHALLLNSSKSG